MNSVVLKNGYIDADDLKKKNKSTQKFITTHWVYSKNKFTQKEFYIEPPNINNYQQNMRFNLLKIACEQQPETFEEKLMRELNLH
uniref:Uncharacterized protein n=1 Tax=Florenciella sp. virus SA2 TaxID=3240092 RepID=A0AB39JEX8_9VIRU